VKTKPFTAFSSLLRHSKPEATDLVIIDELNSALLERCLNLEQS